MNQSLLSHNTSLITYSEPEEKECNSLSVNRSRLILMGQIENWAGRRWGHAWGRLAIDGCKANYNDGHCVIEPEMTDHHTIIASDNMNCGGMNVRF